MQECNILKSAKQINANKNNSENAEAIMRSMLQDNKVVKMQNTEVAIAA